MPYDVQSWVGSIEGNIDWIYVVDIESGAKVKVSPGFFCKLYNDGLIRNMDPNLRKYYNLQLPNPYVGVLTQSVKIIVLEKDSNDWVRNAHVALGSWTADTTHNKMWVLFTNVPKQVFTVTINAVGYEKFTVQLDLTGDGTYFEYIARMTKIVTPIPTPTTTRKGKYIEVYLTDVSKKIPIFGLIPTYLGGGLAKLISNSDLFIAAVNKVMPQGWELMSLNFTRNKMVFKFEELGSPALPILVIIAALKPILIILGLIISSWKVFDWLKEKEKTEQKEIETEQIPVRADCVEQLMNVGVTEETAIAICTSQAEQEDDDDDNFIDDIKELLIYAVGAAVIIMLIQQMGRK